MKNKTLANQFKRVYGITLEEKEKIVQAQQNKCAICMETFKNPKATHIDHDHKTNKIRGVLCPKCNHGLGQFNDNKLLLSNAISYLERYA